MGGGGGETYTDPKDCREGKVSINSHRETNRDTETERQRDQKKRRKWEA
jgi:hypothetical protein